ncbi:DUF3137 domain-containing protein [Photobacterium sp. 1_MG-2023]|uniref:DUF3137 domain-containing protein n=1 Tax=Photobacterium sp. 1_MG-2023 TaxID=3062646 RepID=UPI0026E20343|nr:DUF3137 domain-containing protein [Photobacterium sp. 1_MG-2023]MDO6706624.1 DUF3137 domain-containing protein [Photobacterium sp. 1_MG-2023]
MKRCFLSVIPILASLLMALHSARMGDSSGLIILWLPGLVFLVMYYYVSLKWKVYRDAYKTQVVGKLLKSFNDSFEYSPKDHISPEKYKSSGLYYGHYDRYRGEDYVRGVLGKTAIEFSELHTQYKSTSTDSKGNTRTTWHTIFKGLLFIADANKHFKGKTYITPDSEGFWSLVGKSLNNLLGGSVFGDRVAMEDPEFERHFEVYSNDQVEARYLISTSLMERLVAFRKEANAKVALAFVGDSIHIGIPSRKAYFEPKLFQSAANFDVVKDIYQDLDFITGIVEDLALNTRIWTKA